MSQNFDQNIEDWAASLRVSPSKLREIMLASRQETIELDSAWWKSQFAIMRTAFRASQIVPAIKTP